MIYDTEIFEITDLAKFKNVLDSYRPAMTDMGATDVRLFANLEDPNQVFLNMLWPSVEVCRAFSDRYSACR